jgi:hypothetical protein
MSLVPVPSEQPGATCAGCGAELAPDQRYCLSCGQPASPVRLAFLDVLQTSRERTAVHSPAAWGAFGAIEVAPGGYAAIPPAHGLSGWLRRHSGVLGLLAVLLLCLIAGLLVGHWVTQGRASSGPQVVKIEGLSAAPAASTGAPASTAPSSTTSTSSKSSAKEEAEAAKEVAKETKAEKAPPPPPVKATTKINKLSTTTGKKHEEEVNSLGATPIETG